MVRNPSIILTTDDSHKGWGAIVNHYKTQGLWSQLESESCINILEIHAVKLGLKALLRSVSDQHRMISDNMTKVSYINTVGGCKSKECN